MASRAVAAGFRGCVTLQARLYGNRASRLLSFAGQDDRAWRVLAHVARPLPSAGREEGLVMTTKRSAYNSRLYRDVNDALALAVLVACSTLIMLLA